MKAGPWLISALLLACGGCSTVVVQVTNPVPGLTTVAVAPFFNLSAEPSVDGRRFALSYYSELQKSPGFQVVPVGVVEQAMQENGIDLTGPEDAIRLAQILKVDAIVVGAITEYDPYYPPQLGMQVQWYSPRSWQFHPGPSGAACEPAPSKRPIGFTGLPGLTLRGQSPEAEPASEPSDRPRGPFLAPPATAADRLAAAGGKPKKGLPNPPLWPNRDRSPAGGAALSRASGRGAGHEPLRNWGGDDSKPLAGAEPLMAYTRYFDGADPKLVRSLKNYVTYRGDLRSGGWEAYLHRTDDFVRFASYLMIVEMLSIHGGVAETESVWMLWK